MFIERGEERRDETLDERRGPPGTQAERTGVPGAERSTFVPSFRS
jgi:hypothetical protein